MHYLYLSFAILLEVIGTSLLKKTEGFTLLTPSIILLLCYGLAFFLLSHVVKTIPLGIAYAIWSAGGIFIVSLVGHFFYKQSLDVPAIIGITLIILGVLVINLFSRNVGH